MVGIVGIDVGGTFTDLFFSRDGISADRILKVPSTPDDPSKGLANALLEAGLVASDLDIILHGTTIATNAVIERTGAKTALITTKGFRDVLELGRRDRPRVYGLTGVHVPLVPRTLRMEVAERVDNKGAVVEPLNEDRVREIGGYLLSMGVQAVVVSFLHSYANSAHEDRACAILREISLDWETVSSSSVVREYFEFERTSTAVVQGYLQPLVSGYVSNLQKRLKDNGFETQTLIMQSNGGLVPLSQLPNKAANIVRSGPAAGVMAAVRIAQEAGFVNIITGDMGGTSYDVSLVDAGRPHIADVTELDFRTPLRLPMVDIHTIGAGGGSIAYLDRGNTLQVGPRSAGSMPGPVSFGRGGTEPTVADANVVLGRINAASPIGLKHLKTLNVEGARAAMAKLGEPIGLDIEQTAIAILTIVNHRMAGRTRLLSVEKGYDPRDFALVVFGGAGPLHGAAIMREVGTRLMLIPPQPGVLCAQGCAIADLRYDTSQTVESALDALDFAWVQSVIAAQRDGGVAQVEDSGVPIERIEISHAAEMSYVGQIHSLRVDLPPPLTKKNMSVAFRETYKRKYGKELGDLPISVGNIKTTVRGIRQRATTEDAKAPAVQCATTDIKRRVFFDAPVETPVYDRAKLKPGMVFDGPAIIEQADTTSVIEPGMTCRVDRFGNILVEMM